jgi:hypothetical protein
MLPQKNQLVTIKPGAKHWAGQKAVVQKVMRMPPVAVVVANTAKTLYVDDNGKNVHPTQLIQLGDIVGYYSTPKTNDNE